MNEHDILKALKSKQRADAPLFEARLRRALLGKHSGKNGFAMLPTFLTRFAMKKYSIPSAVLGVFAIALVLNFAGVTPQTASAQEVAQRAFTRAKQISPEMRAKLEAYMKSDMLETLKEARAAKDLRILTPEEYAKEAQFTISTSSNAVAFSKALSVGEPTNVKMVRSFNHELPEGGTIGGETGSFTVSAAHVKDMPVKGNVTFSAMGTIQDSAGLAGDPASMPMPVKYLSYTNPQGGKVVLGLDANDTPVFKMETLTAGDVVKLEDGSIGVQGKAVKMINIEELE